MSVDDINKHKMMPPKAKAAIPIRPESNDNPVTSRNQPKLLRFTPSNNLNTNDRKKPKSNPMERKEDSKVVQSLTMPKL